MQALWHLQSEASFELKGDVATIGILDGEGVPIVDLITGGCIDNKAILVVDVDVIDSIILPNTRERFENDLVGRGVVGESVVDPFDQQPTILGDGYDRTR